MAKLLAVFKREYLERVRSKWFLVATFLGPVFFGVLAILPGVLASRTKGSTDVAHIQILDATGTDLGERVRTALVKQTLAPDSLAPELRAVSPAELAEAESLATRRVVAREIKGYLRLDQATLEGRLAHYAGRNASTLRDVTLIERTVRQSVLAQRFEREGISRERVLQLTSINLDTRTEKIGDRGREGSGGLVNVFFGYTIAFLLYMMIAIYGQTILRGVMEEKMTRVAEVVVSSVKPDILLAGKVLGVGSVALTQVFVWLGLGTFFYTQRGAILERLGVTAEAAATRLPSIAPGVAVALLLLFVLGFVFYATLFAAVGAMVDNQEDAQQAQMPVMLLLISAIIFMNPTLLNPSSTLAKVTSWLPFSAPILMPLRMAMSSVPWLEIAATILGLVLASVAATWLSARIYRVGLLMYGKRPTMRELVRWIRVA